MKTRTRRILFITLLLGLALVVAACAPLPPAESSEVQDLREQVSVLQTQVAQLQSDEDATGPVAIVTADDDMQHMRGQMSGMMGEMQGMMGDEMNPEAMNQMMGMMSQMSGMMGEMQGMMGEGMDSDAMNQMMGMMSQMSGMMGEMHGTMGEGTQHPDESGSSADASDLTQSAEAGAVTVDVTPLTLMEEDPTSLDFEIALNTHSVELDADLADLAVLLVNGQEIVATNWQSPASGGHHVSGKLSFPATGPDGKPILADAENVSLIIRNLAGVPERVFTWELAGQ